MKQEVLSMMMDSDIAQIIWDKKREWGLLEGEKKKVLKWKRWDNRKILDLIFLEDQEDINKLTTELSYILRYRQWWWDNSNAEDLQNAKDNISILDVIQVVTWIRPKNRHLSQILCPFKWHNEKTPSFNIYKNTNTCYCEGCKRGGSQVDFIMYATWCTVHEAIKNFLSFYKK